MPDTDPFGERLLESAARIPVSEPPGSEDLRLVLAFADRGFAEWNLHELSKGHSRGLRNVLPALPKNRFDVAIEPARPCERIVKALKLSERVVGKKLPVLR